MNQKKPTGHPSAENNSHGILE